MPLAERLRADEALDHAQHAGRLLVGDAVEHLVDLVGRFDLDPNRARRAQRVEPQRRLRVGRVIEFDLPFRTPHGERPARDPGGEALVQPDVVPPLHRHEVAEPLVRDLVRDDRRDVLAHAERGALRVDQQQPLAEGDRAGVLHRARGEVRDRDDVELAERVLDAEVVVVEGELLLGGLERKRGQSELVRRRAHADRRAVGRARPADEVADDHGDEIRRHLRRRRERDGVLARLRSRRIRHLGAVRDRRVALVDHQRDLERGLVDRARRTTGRPGARRSPPSA